jgi:hypothetical protein
MSRSELRRPAQFAQNANYVREAVASMLMITDYAKVASLGPSMKVSANPENNITPGGGAQKCQQCADDESDCADYASRDRIRKPGETHESQR